MNEPQETEPPQSIKPDKKCRHTVLKIAEKLYFIHLFFALIASIVLIVIEDHLR
jgi:hypothetical protein